MKRYKDIHSDESEHEIDQLYCFNMDKMEHLTRPTNKNKNLWIETCAIVFGENAGGEEHVT